MCPYTPQINLEAMRDLWRGRLYDAARWRRIERFAHRRWMAAHDMPAANKWRVVLASAKRRQPK
jgi:hypothetical protein